MTDRKRIAITVASALALAVTGVGRQWTVGSGLVTHIWAFAFLAACGVAVIGVFFVNRRWALLPAFSTVGVGLLAAAIYTPPDPWSYESYSVSFGVEIVFLLFAAAAFAAFLAIGLVARRIWDRFRHPNLSTATPKGIDR
jgi:hypothetical protein